MSESRLHLHLDIDTGGLRGKNCIRKIVKKFYNKSVTNVMANLDKEVWWSSG